MSDLEITLAIISLLFASAALTCLILWLKSAATLKAQRNSEQIIQESLKSAEIAMLKQGRESFRDEAKQFTDKTLQEFQTITKKVHQLSDRIEGNEEISNMLWNSLNSTSLIGQFSEIGLENTLKKFGLTQGIDYLIQKGTSEKRPDAIIMLPDDRLIVIDSKASSFFTKLANATEERDKKELQIKLVKQMYTHLKNLLSKEYLTVTDQILKKENINNKIQHQYMVMFIQNERFIEQLLEIEPNFVNECIKRNILLSGPTGLQSMLSLSKAAIELIKQDNNQIIIRNEISHLLSHLRKMFGYIESIGTNLEKASKAYSKLVKSSNRYAIPKAHKIKELGISPNDDIDLPKSLNKFEVIQGNDDIITPEFDEDNVVSLEKKD